MNYLSFSMLTSYIKVAFRNMRKDSAGTTINVIGLTVALCCGLLIILFVEDELSYDQFHENSDRIYRLRVDRIASGGETEYTSTSSAMMLPTAINELPQIESGARLMRRAKIVRYGDVTYSEERFFYVDPTFFNVFSFDLLKGNPETVLSAPNSLILTASSAEKYFSDADPIGKAMEVDGISMTVTGVAADTPSRSHFAFDMLSSTESLDASELDNWWSLDFHSYLKLRAGTDVVAVQKLIQEMPSRYIGNQETSSGYRQFLYLQPLKDIHLRSSFQFELESNSQIEYIFAFSAVAFFLILIACVNFTNLSTARSTARLREVGMRKVLGAESRQLISQFLGESIITALIALAIALILTQLLLPVFNEFANKALAFNIIERWPLLLIIVLGAVFVGMLAGVYPAFSLSSLKPIEMLRRSGFSSGFTRFGLRQALVVFQFAISVGLIIVTIITQRQLDYMLNADTGFDRDQILVVNGGSSEALLEQSAPIRESIASVPGVLGVTLSSSVPGRPTDGAVASLQRGMVEGGQSFNVFHVDYDFIDTYGLELESGRKFSEEMGSDDTLAYILNEAAYKSLGWADPEQPLGKEVTRQFVDTRNIVGIVKDFNYKSLQYPVEPIFMVIDPSTYEYISIKISGSDIDSTLRDIETSWGEVFPDQPFEYFFLDEDFERLYRSEILISSLLNLFTLLAIGIACMGLFALASFITRKKRREIAIRKVLGAPTPRVVLWLVYTFAKPILLASVIAIPACWLVGTQWLNTFANRIAITGDIFFIAVLLSLLVALITVGWQSVIAANGNPTVSLRSE